MDPSQTLKVEKHKKFFLRFLDRLPTFMESSDSIRMLFVYYSVAGLDVLNSMDELDSTKQEALIEWIYSLQIVNDKELVSGFQASPTLNTKPNRSKNSPLRWGHLTATYVALCSLVILGDDLSRVNRKAIAKSMRVLQLDNGCFLATKKGTESDMRFLYCAAAVCYLIDDWSGFNVDKAVDFILKSISYEYGISQVPGSEAHGGSTYCAIATLVLCNRLHLLSKQQREGIIRWLLFRQEGGFKGRPNKSVDTCYSFWVGAALKMLGAYHFVSFKENITFLLLTQGSITGGFSKSIGEHVDPYHSYLGLVGISFMQLEGYNLSEVIPELNISVRSYERLQLIHKKWQSDAQISKLLSKLAVQFVCLFLIMSIVFLYYI